MNVFLTKMFESLDLPLIVFTFGFSLNIKLNAAASQNQYNELDA